jgi:AraC-like DNA-binding protein
MRAHIRERLTLAEFARAAGNIGPDRLLQIFRRNGESPCRTFRRLKMEAAAELLIHNAALRVKEVALQMGYAGESLERFHKEFRAIHRLSPGRYRDAALERERH